MNAEINVSLDLTVELETSGVTLTIFHDDDHDGTVYTVTYDKLVDDLIELCTYDDFGGVVEGDLKYGLKVAEALEAAAASIRQKFNAA